MRWNQSPSNHTCLFHAECKGRRTFPSTPSSVCLGWKGELPPMFTQTLCNAVCTLLSPSLRTHCQWVELFLRPPLHPSLLGHCQCNFPPSLPGTAQPPTIRRISPPRGFPRDPPSGLELFLLPYILKVGGSYS